MRIYFSEAYNETGVGFDTTRKAVRVARLLGERPIEGVCVVAPVAASFDELAEVHDVAYLDALVGGEPYSLAASNGIGWDPQLLAAAAASTGGIRDAALAALAEGRSGSLSSGLHHAKAGKGHGYCTLNGLVVAARAAIGAGARRVVIVDLDAHCGGGTASLIDGVEGIEQVDVSVSYFDPYESRPDARLTMARAGDYLDVISGELAEIAAPGSIDLVLYNAGMDPHEDAQGVSGITTEVIVQREELVFGWAARYRLPVAFALAGGYQYGDFTLDDVAALHAITIRAAARWN